MRRHTSSLEGESILGTRRGAPTTTVTLDLSGQMFLISGKLIPKMDCQRAYKQTMTQCFIPGTSSGP
jgi:hypothetical protein